jgi:8-oxo-dGTP pyrophosphatase MutT (NUDIX family)
MGDRVEVTWDGQAVATEPPFGATVVVYRQGVGGAELLVLHRPHAAREHEVDWVWTPPAGARYPGEEIGACAARELGEETGLDVELVPIRRGEWFLYAARLVEPVPVRLSDEHDEYRWVPLVAAIGLCQPEVVAEGIRAVAEALDLD